MVQFSSLAGKRIVCYKSDDDLTFSLNNTLSDAGCILLDPTRHEESVIEFVQYEKPDILLIDADYAEIGELEFIAKATERSPTYVVLMAEGSENETELFARLTQAHGYVCKPVSEVNLLECLNLAIVQGQESRNHLIG